MKLEEKSLEITRFSDDRSLCITNLKSKVSLLTNGLNSLESDMAEVDKSCKSVEHVRKKVLALEKQLKQTASKKCVSKKDSERGVQCISDNVASQVIEKSTESTPIGVHPINNGLTQDKTHPSYLTPEVRESTHIPSYSECLQSNPGKVRTPGDLQPEQHAKPDQSLFGCKLWNNLSKAQVLALERSERAALKIAQGLPRSTRTHTCICNALLGWTSLESEIDKRKLLFLGNLTEKQRYSLWCNIVDRCSVEGHQIKSIMKISKVILFEYLVFVYCQYCERPYNEAHFKQADSSFKFSDVLLVQNTPKSLHCLNKCLLHTRCVGARFVAISGQCHMYAAYQTKTTAGTRTSGDKYYIMEGECGSQNPSQSFIYWRECVLASTTVCSSTEAFLGRNTSVWCIPGPPTWTPAPGGCINTNPIRMKGTYIHPLDSGVSFVGTPNENMFRVYFVTASGDYLLRLNVIIDQQSVTRSFRNNSVYQGRETNLVSGFPFEMTKKFTMDIISTATEFLCKVNGATLFTYQHRLPRDSVDSIKVFKVNIEKVLLI
ncbi:uncharacterized protein [Haliotis asinina]|uniref:uncharacterized protein n=1 Tax=Haliotis asinina TaxID=109174 RepID=UPI003531B52F